jgi:hypothetical protein
LQTEIQLLFGQNIQNNSSQNTFFQGEIDLFVLQVIFGIAMGGKWAFPYYLIQACVINDLVVINKLK